MVVNPVWYGVLLTLVAEIMLVILIGILNAITHRDDEEPEINEVTLPPELEEEFIKAIKNYEEKKRNGL